MLCSWCRDVGLLGIALEPTWCSQSLRSLCKEPVFSWRKVFSCSRVELMRNQGDPQDLGAREEEAGAGGIIQKITGKGGVGV